MTKIYVTKYALTDGVREHEADILDGGKYARVKAASCTHLNQLFCGKDFHLNEYSAIERAEEMRIKKLQSLDKQIKKMSALTFEVKKS